MIRGALKFHWIKMYLFWQQEKGKQQSSAQFLFMELISREIIIFHRNLKETRIQRMPHIVINSRVWFRPNIRDTQSFVKFVAVGCSI